ncbi:prephenate dehydratase [Clostridium sp. MD294]|uniref:prephenate dehydratase n=1 Tax=Clostridium sp. MD294 TaxID=97138 RepID=UPI0002CC1E31|nr:prephenate dehydratase [Clostridium sp. MD294]NDO46944.1 prephenate dehydratase [Clostridium sp. MD294]USF31393.1 Prephenate dehydratase [Clostridium sp. MD294]
MKIGYLGPDGTFSQQAVLLYQKTVTDKTTLLQYNNIYAALEGVIKNEIEECVVPLENSIEGTVTSTIDLLIFTPELYIKGEIIIPVWEDFLVKKEYNGEKITKILSHPQALSQCTGFLRKYFPDVLLQATNSTAEAAKMVAESKECIASLSPKQSAKVYQLKALYEGVQDDDQNKTRFVVVSKQKPKQQAKGKKTSIVFTTGHKPGDLYRILDIISIWDINMTKIESRPMKHQLGTYIFFVDLETEVQEDLDAALKMIARKTTYFKFLGSYMVLK